MFVYTLKKAQVAETFVLIKTCNRNVMKTFDRAIICRNILIYDKSECFLIQSFRSKIRNKRLLRIIYFILCWNVVYLKFFPKRLVSEFFLLIYFLFLFFKKNSTHTIYGIMALCAIILPVVIFGLLYFYMLLKGTRRRQTSGGTITENVSIINYASDCAIDIFF